MSRLLEQREKRARIKALLEAKGLDAVVLKKGANVAWIIGGRAHIPTTLELSCMDVVVYRDLSPQEQIKASIKYIHHRYKDSCDALTHFERKGWH